MTVGELRRGVAARLSAANIEDAVSMAKYLICDEMDMSTTDMLMRDRDEMDNKVQSVIADKVERLAEVNHCSMSQAKHIFMTTYFMWLQEC